MRSHPVHGSQVAGQAAPSHLEYLGPPIGKASTSNPQMPWTSAIPPTIEPSTDHPKFHGILIDVLSVLSKCPTIEIITKKIGMTRRKLMSETKRRYNAGFSFKLGPPHRPAPINRRTLISIANIS